MPTLLFYGLFLAVFLGLSDRLSAQESLHLYSTQLVPIEEARRFSQRILSGFKEGPVQFTPLHQSPFMAALLREPVAPKGEVDLVAGILLEELIPLAEKGLFKPLPELAQRLLERGVPAELLAEARSGPESPQAILPWMRATYIMVARRQALDYLPKGASLHDLSYEELLLWAKALKEGTGAPRLAFPAGEKGLFQILLPGVILPAFSGGVVNGFARSEAAWDYLQRLWPQVNPDSTTFNFMQDHLLSGEAWVAMDHTARLLEVFRTRPGEFVAFPVPRGPKGRYARLTTIGLAVPANAADGQRAMRLADFLTTPAVQERLLLEVGFLPVTRLEGEASRGDLAALVAAARSQNENPATRRVDNPKGLGAREAAFNSVFMATFSRIVLRGKPADAVLKEQGEALQELYRQNDAPCVAPDRVGERPCRITP
ncbi:MAG: extracellular solute-binding protein [Magnetococcales bacterium]|nr:extracellular solute-binding protein [Magnetococcales bacterium]